MFSIALVSGEPALQQQFDSAVASLDPSLSLFSYADIPEFLAADIYTSLVVVDDVSGQLSSDLLQQLAEQQAISIRVLCLPMMQDEQLVMQLGAFHLFYSRTLSTAELSDLLYRPQLLRQLDLPLSSIRAVLAARHLPISAPISIQLQEMLLDPDLAIEAIVPVVEQDAVLSTRLLQLANSPYMGFSRSTSSLEIAISRIGLNLVYGLVVTLAAADIEPDAPMPDWLLWSWQHARESRIFAMQLGLANDVQELCFSCALLSGIGEAVLRSDTTTEHLHSLSAPAITAVLLTVWGFPSNYVKPILQQEQVQTDLHNQDAQIAGVLGVAALLCPKVTSLSRQYIDATAIQSYPNDWQHAFTTLQQQRQV